MHISLQLWANPWARIDEVWSLVQYTGEVKSKVVSSMSVDSSRAFKLFAIAQLTGGSGAGTLHKWSNRDNTSYANIDLFDRDAFATNPKNALEHKRALWDK